MKVPSVINYNNRPPHPRYSFESEAILISPLLKSLSIFVVNLNQIKNNMLRRPKITQPEILAIKKDLTQLKCM